MPPAKKKTATPTAATKPKGRAAGNKGTYTIQVVDQDGNARGKGMQLPSVTTILNAMPKDGLQWWGFKLGLAAAQELENRGQLTPDLDDLYTAAKLTDHAPHRALKAAGTRGTDVHDLAETLIAFGSLDVLDVPPSKRGYAKALVAWYEANPILATTKGILVEEALFSLKHGFAGTADLIYQLDEFHWRLIDFKTSKGIYDSHLLQLAAYRTAAVEMGHVPAHSLFEAAAVRLGADGKYEERFSTYGIEDFMCVKSMYELLQSDRGKK